MTKQRTEQTQVMGTTVDRLPEAQAMTKPGSAITEPCSTMTKPGSALAEPGSAATEARLAISSAKFAAEKNYQVTMLCFRQMLDSGFITPEDYRQIDTIMLRKYHPVFGSLYAKSA